MIKVVLIGAGNLAQHLISSFGESKYIDLVQVFSRQKEAVSSLIDSNKITNNFTDLAVADLYILVISDDSIAEVSSQLPFENRLVVHTAGSVSLNFLDPKNRRGVFYPLQTFSKNKAVDFSEIPICLETELDDDFEIVEKLAQALSNQVFKINERQRQALHVSAVFANNFVNHLYHISFDICTKNNIPFEVLKPLILETANKVMSLSPAEAQTGPGIRFDSTTIENHINLLKNENQKVIYRILTQSIQNNDTKL